MKGFFGVSGTNPDPGQKGGNISMDEVRTSVLNALFELDDTCRGLFKEYNAFRNSLKSLASDAQIPGRTRVTSHFDFRLTFSTLQ